MKKLVSFALLTLALVFSLAIFGGCVSTGGLRSVRGRGDRELNIIDATGFTGISINGGTFDMVFNQSPDFSVELYIQDNLFRHVDTEVSGSMLHINSDRSFNTVSGETPRLTINAPSLNHFNVSGAVNANMVLDTSTLNIDVQGAANIVLEGTANELSISASGAANVSAFDLIAQYVTVVLNGAGNVDVYASETLDARLNGVGRIRHDGNAEVTRRVAGLGTISPRR